MSNVSRYTDVYGKPAVLRSSVMQNKHRPTILLVTQLPSSLRSICKQNIIGLNLCTKYYVELYIFVKNIIYYFCFLITRQTLFIIRLCTAYLKLFHSHLLHYIMITLHSLNFFCSQANTLTEMYTVVAGSICPARYMTTLH